MKRKIILHPFFLPPSSCHSASSRHRKTFIPNSRPVCLCLPTLRTSLSPSCSRDWKTGAGPGKRPLSLFPLCQTLTVLRWELHRERLDRRSWHDSRPNRRGQSDVLLTSPSAVSDERESHPNRPPPLPPLASSRPALLRRGLPSSLGDPCGYLSCLHFPFPSPSLHLRPPFIVQLAGR